MHKQGVEERINSVHTPLMIIALISSLFLNKVFPLSLAFIVSLFTILKSAKPVFLSSFANWVTLSRGILITMLPIGLHQDIVLFIVTIAIALDLVDGWVARSQNSVSAFGAYLDGGTDAYFVSIVTIYLYVHGDVPYISLLVCFLPYIMVSILLASIRITKAPIQSKLPSWIAGLHFLALVLMLLSKGELSQLFFTITSYLVTLSFCYYDFARLRLSK